MPVDGLGAMMAHPDSDSARVDILADVMRMHAFHVKGDGGDAVFPVDRPENTHPFDLIQLEQFGQKPGLVLFESGQANLLHPLGRDPGRHHLGHRLGPGFEAGGGSIYWAGLFIQASSTMDPPKKAGGKASKR